MKNNKSFEYIQKKKRTELYELKENDFWINEKIIGDKRKKLNNKIIIINQLKNIKKKHIISERILE